MKYYLYIAVAGLMAAGCSTMQHGAGNAHHPPPRAHTAQTDENRPMHPGMAQRPMLGQGRMAGVGPRMSLGEEHFGNVFRALMESRKNGYLSNDQYADLLEKLMGDSRWIVVEEIKASRPPGPMRPEPPPAPEKKRKHKEDN